MAKTKDIMDYAAHEQTFAFFIAMLKFSITAMVIGAAALYAFIIAGNFWLGLFLLVVSVPAGIGANMLGKPKK
ncbi:MAG: aa3-type cytochrome c oxidase subunit IV [Alphaproteobacteria bacterium]|nr:aa3-type cytochrome c oxidase subunit IV [Alphaproteobacteria bacterium]